MELGFDFPAMAGMNEVRVAGAHEALLHRAAQAAIAEVRRIESRYSRYDPDSIVSRINAAAGSGRAVPVDAETAGLLGFAGQLHQFSEGRFDITAGVLRRAWDFRRPRLPQQAELQPLLALIGWPKVRLAAGSIELPLVGMELDFGGFGKEYAADRAAEVLVQAGVAHGYVNLGGDIRVVGPRTDGGGWCFGLQHPRRADALIGQVVLTDGALATSGDYERFFDLDGQRYCHLIDPRSGWPVRHWQSVSVIGPTCAAAGALSTLTMLRDEQGLEWLQSQEVDFMLVDSTGQFRTSAAMASHAGGVQESTQ
jgi:thiamine biosynthesis lipoprotein